MPIPVSAASTQDGLQTRRAWLAGLGLAATLILLLLAGRLWFMPGHFSTDPNEGWNAFQAAQATGTGLLYPRPGSLTGNNYPPLSFLIVGWLGRLTGDVIVAGRGVAVLSVLIVAGLVFVAARLACVRPTVEPALGSLLFLAFNATLFRPYFAMDDPQWLGHALMTTGMVVLLANTSSPPVRPARIAIAAFLVLCGGLVKHNLVAFPLAATVWFMLHDRRGLAVWITISSLLLLAATVLLYHAYGMDFFADLLASDRHYSVLRMAAKSAGPVLLMLPMIFVTSRLWRVRTLDPRLDLLLLMAAISVPLGIIQRSGQGVDRNAHFEALIALCMTTAVSLERCGFAMRRPLLARPLPWLIAPFLVLLPGALDNDGAELLHRHDRQLAWRTLQDRIAAVPGPVACETPAFCFWAGKRFGIDFFLTGQRLAIHHDAAALTEALADCRFSAIELDRERPSPPPGEIRNPADALVAKTYRTVFVDHAGNRLLLPVSCPADAPARPR